MTTRNVNKQANAFANGRERRRELDKARDRQDRRVEQATALALVALDTRKDAETSLNEATEGLADALRRMVVRMSVSNGQQHCWSWTQQKSGV